MLREFENRLADVLGTRLPAPLAGAVDVAPGRDVARLVLGVRTVAPIEDELLTARPERVPGAVAPRRILRLRCEVGLEMRLPQSGTRADLMLALDRTLYLLGDASFYDGSALLPEDDSDPGFLIRRMRIIRSEPPVTLMVDAEGFFWPVGEVGQTGPTISDIRLRHAVQPLRLSPDPSNLVAGGAAVDFVIGFGAEGTFQITEEETTQRPYGSIAVSVVGSGGRPGAGTLGGGLEGVGGVRVLPVDSGVATVRYTPPAEPAVDFLVVTLEDNEGGPAIELGRFRLAVRGA
jgi:hypothetical protein